MFQSKSKPSNEIERMKDDITLLRNKVEMLEASTSIESAFLDPYTGSISRMTYSYTIGSMVRAIADHLGLEYKAKQETPAHFVFKRKK